MAASAESVDYASDGRYYRPGWSAPPTSAMLMLFLVVKRSARGATFLALTGLIDTSA